MFPSLPTVWLLCVSLLQPGTVYLVLGASNISCPTGLYYNTTTNKCQCVEFLVEHQYISCNQQKNRGYIRSGVCLTTGATNNSYMGGLCPLTIGNWKNMTNRLWSELPSDPDMLNATMCGPYNREGLLCGKCLDGYGLPVYSLGVKCVNCSRFSTSASITLYVILEIVSTTLFFVFVTMFRLNVTSGPLLGYFLFCQVIYMGTMNRTSKIIHYILTHASQPLKLLCQISFAFTEFWALMFFRSLIPPFCISEKLTSIHVQLLTMVPPIYVVLLVISIFALIELHAINCKAFQKPFVYFRCCSSDAIIRAFATFTFLSSTAVILSVYMLSFNIDIQSSSIPSITNTSEGVLYIDPSVVYLSHEHILYLLIALVPCVSLVLIPALLLCVYPTRIYRSLSRLISTRKQLAITTFAEALHNCFKDGLNGTRDYRSLAGLIIFSLPIGSLMTYITWLAAGRTTGYPRNCTTGFLFFALSLVVAYVRPCKSTLANLSLSYHAFMLGILTFGVSYWGDLSIGTEALELAFILIPLVSHILAVSWAVYSISQYVRRNWTDLSSVLRCVNVRNRNGYQQLPDTASVGVEHNHL